MDFLRKYRRLPNLALLLLAVCDFGCASLPAKPAVADPHSGSFDSKFKFRVTLRDGAGEFRKSGSDLEWREGQLVVKDKQGQDLVHYPREAIRDINSVRESYWKEGLGFGALAGAVGGAVAGLAMSFSCDESSDCRIAAWTAPLAIGIPLGTLIGWGVGLATDKRKAVRIFPNFSSSNGETRAGVGAGLEF